jgi:hypothetical protein
MRQKTGGRKAKTPNKTTSEMRAVFNQLLSNNLDGIQDILDQLEPMQKLTIIMKISEFVLPKLQSTQMEVAVTDKIHSFIQWGDERIPI